MKKSWKEFWSFLLSPSMDAAKHNIIAQGVRTSDFHKLPKKLREDKPLYEYLEQIDEIMESIIQDPGVQTNYTDIYNTLFTLSNGTQIVAWSGNMYFGWFSRGTVYSNNQIIYHWNDRSPSKSMMYKLYMSLYNRDLLIDQKRNDVLRAALGRPIIQRKAQQ